METIEYSPNSQSGLHPLAHTEWKYVDAQSIDGWKLISIFYPRIGINPATVSTYLNSPEGNEWSQHQINQAALAPSSLSIADQILEFNRNGALLTLDNPIVSTRLSFSPVIRPIQIPIDQNGMLWQIEMPRAEVHGRLVHDNQEITFHGRGYHDHNWFYLKEDNNRMTNRELLPLFLRGWQFGRLFGDKLSIVYGFSPTESHFCMWDRKDLIKNDNANRLLITGSSFSERLKISRPSKFDLAQLNLDAQIELHNILSEKKLSLSSDGTQTGYIRVNSYMNNDQLGYLEGIHEIWL